jgi:hypothetical protein
LLNKKVFTVQVLSMLRPIIFNNCDEIEVNFVLDVDSIRGDDSSCLLEIQ